MTIRNTNKRNSFNLLDNSYNLSENVIKINKNNTLDHELAKFLIAWECIQNGDDIITEAIFKTGDRADVFVLQQCEAKEIVMSESKKSIIRKKQTYPCKVTVFKAKDIIDYWKNKIGDKHE